MAYEYSIIFTRYRDNHVSVHKTRVMLFDNPPSDVIPAMLSKLITNGRTATRSGNTITVKEASGDVRGTIQINSKTVSASNEDNFIQEFNDVSP